MVWEGKHFLRFPKWESQGGNLPDENLLDVILLLRSAMKQKKSDSSRPGKPCAESALLSRSQDDYLGEYLGKFVGQDERKTDLEGWA